MRAPSVTRVFQQKGGEMAAISRREFCRMITADATLVGLAVSRAMALRANPLGLPIGCQTWPVRALIAKDFPGTIKQLADAGFQAIEMCSPVGYADSGFGGLARFKGAELRRMLSDAGVSCESSHFGIQELRDGLDDRIAWAKDLGLTQMMVPTLSGPRTPTMDDVKRAADEYNRIAERTKQAGLQQGLHNEEFELTMVELTMVDGRRTYDVLLDLLDPELVKFQFQCSTISRGYDAAEYFTKYPGRFISMHVQDWSPEKKQTVTVGQGALDCNKIFAAATTGGLKNYFVEMNLELMKASVPYLRQLS
jgi:sugar phosphate isomerase/epimerase